MTRYLLIAAICAGVWFFVKQTAITFQSPRVWDWAELASAITAAVVHAYVYQPSPLQTDPFGVLVLRSLEFGLGIYILALALAIPAEIEGLLRTPDKLAPPKARLAEQVVSVDDLDEGTLVEYVEEGV